MKTFMCTYRTIWWLLLSLFLRLLQCVNATNDEGDALIAVKASIKYPNGVLDSWDSEMVNPCGSWYLIRCDAQNHVIYVGLSNQRLSGTLSPDIGKLPYLQTLMLDGNSLAGPLPTQLGNLKQLLILNVGNNSFTGSIPGTLRQLSKLHYLDLSYNNLTGNIPDSVFKIPEYNFVGNHLYCGSSYQSVCQLNTSLTAQASSSNRSKSRIVIGGSIGGFLALFILVVLSLIFYGRHHQLRHDVFVDVAAEHDLKIAYGQLKNFSWLELQTATDNFSDQNVIGHGGSSKVYKGILENGTKIAVKQLKENHFPGGEAVFLREVELISMVAHRNLLCLIGFCITPSQWFLVYPYKANGSVAYRLREIKSGEIGLDWSRRKRIALGAARGLAYLHDHCNPKIIHRDVKAANVLLDEEFEAVIGDFGLAKVVDTRSTHVTTMVRGTIGHIAPEYLSAGKASEKTDVFGFGVMLLELITGHRAIEFSQLQDEDDVLLLDHVKALQHQRLFTFVDKHLNWYNVEEVEELTHVALLCTQYRPEDRPKMSEVVRLLVGEGLAERWEEWQQLEVIRRKEYEMIPKQLAECMEYYLNQEAIELSVGR